MVLVEHTATVYRTVYSIIKCSTCVDLSLQLSPRARACVRGYLHGVIHPNLDLDLDPVTPAYLAMLRLGLSAFDRAVRAISAAVERSGEPNREQTTTSTKRHSWQPWVRSRVLLIRRPSRLPIPMLLLWMSMVVGGDRTVLCLHPLKLFVVGGRRFGHRRCDPVRC